jgi:hypothetical protein
MADPKDAGAGDKIRRAVLGWPGVTAHAHRFGGTEFRLGRREIGHTHGGRLVDIPFPTAVRNELVESGQAEPHHVLPRSGWVSLRVRGPEDVETAIRLLRRSYDLAVRQKSHLGRPG